MRFFLVIAGQVVVTFFEKPMADVLTRARALGYTLLDEDPLSRTQGGLLVPGIPDGRNVEDAVPEIQALSPDITVTPNVRVHIAHLRAGSECTAAIRLA